MNRLVRKYVKLADSLKMMEARITRMNEILDEVCHSMRLDKQVVLGRDRHQNIVCARHVTMYLIRKRLDVRISDIADFFSVDHASVCHAIRSVLDQVELNQLTARTTEPVDFKKLGL